MTRRVPVLWICLAMGLLAFPATGGAVLSAQGGGSPAGTPVRAYGGPTLTFTEINGSGALLLGIRAGLYATERVTLGLAGRGLLNEIGMAQPSPDASKVAMGYGGLEVGFEALRSARATVLFSLFAGGGSVGGRRPIEGFLDLGDQEHDGFGILEPGVEVGWILRPEFHLLVEGTYRITTGLLEASGSADPGQVLDARGLNGPGLGIHLRFGHLGNSNQRNHDK